MLASPEYLDSVEQIAGIPDDYREMRARSLHSLLEYGDNFVQRGRALTDAYHIAIGDWRRDPDWSPKDIRVIPEEGHSEPARVDTELWKNLLSRIEEQIKEIPDSYAAFQTEPAFQAPDKSDDNAVDAYIAWFTRYMPVLTLDLDPRAPAAWGKAVKRLRWMLDKAPDDVSFETTLEADALHHLLLWVGSAEK